MGELLEKNSGHVYNFAWKCWWGDGDDDNDDNAVHSRQLLNSWQFDIHQTCAGDIYFDEWFISWAIQIISFYAEHEAIYAVGAYFIHDDITCFIYYIS